MGRTKQSSTPPTAEVAERPIDCYAMYTRSAKPGFALLTLITVWSLTRITELHGEFEIATDPVGRDTEQRAGALE